MIMQLLFIKFTKQIKKSDKFNVSALKYQNMKFQHITKKWNNSIVFNITKKEDTQQKMRKRATKFPNQQQTELYDKITKIETKILGKLTYLKKNKKYIECKHLQNKPVCEEYDPNVNYYDKFWKTFLINEVSHKRIQDLNQYLDEYLRKIQEVEDLLERHQELTGIHSKRRSRRLAEEIVKQCECPYPKCFKIYGSEVSLNLHIKLKHNGGNKTDRQKAAQLIWQAREKNKPIPQFYINLPPGFIQEYGVLTKRLDKLPQKPESQ